MDYIPSLLDRYYEIYQFVLNSDQYKEFIHLRKKLNLPYSFTFEHDAVDQSDLESTFEYTSVIEQTPDGENSIKVKSIDRMLNLYDLIKARVWDKYQHQLIDVDEWDTDLDKVDAFHLLFGKDPVLIVPIATSDAFKPEQSQEQQLGIDRYKTFTIAIDPQLNRKELWLEIQKTLGIHLGEKQTPRNPKKRKITKYAAFKLARAGHTFLSIGKQFGVDKTTAHKAYIRDFQDIFGTKTVPGKRSRRAVPTYQLTKTCATCGDRSQCTKLCSEMNAFVNQDAVNQSHKILDGTSELATFSFKKLHKSPRV